MSTNFGHDQQKYHKNQRKSWKLSKSPFLKKAFVVQGFQPIETCRKFTIAVQQTILAEMSLKYCCWSVYELTKCAAVGQITWILSQGTQSIVLSEIAMTFLWQSLSYLKS